MFDHLYRLVCIYTPRGIKWVLGKIFGQRAPDALDGCWTYVCFTSNPIVQLFYLCIIVGGYAVFVWVAYPHIPNPYMNDWHKFAGFGVFVACLLVWVKASFTDPGAVTQANVDALCEYYEWDEQIFTSAECRTCKMLKPARSKHCSLCGICVARSDHHCIWLNNCVGVGNHRYFLGFLFWHSVICAYGASLGCTIIAHMVFEKKLFDAVFIDPNTKERFNATYVIVFQYLLATDGMLIFVTLLCAIMGLVLFGFFVWHMNLIRMGTTTNELCKWKFLKYCLKREGEEGLKHLAALRNIYNEGLSGNFRQVLFPIDVHRLERKPKVNGELAEADAPDSQSTPSKERKEPSGKKGKKTKAA